MIDPPPSKPRGSIRSRMQAERAAAGSTMASALMGWVFALGALATWGSPEHPYRIYTICAALALAFAVAMDRRKSVVLATAILIAAVLLAVWGVCAGQGKLFFWLAVILPAAFTGLKGARALRRSDLPSWA
jgi:hypothetical protein